MTIAYADGEVRQNDTALSWLGVCFPSNYDRKTRSEDTIIITSPTCHDGSYRLVAFLFMQRYESLRSRRVFVNVIGFAGRQNTVTSMFDRC
jgi:hypothetical protein